MAEGGAQRVFNGAPSCLQGRCKTTAVAPTACGENPTGFSRGSTSTRVLAQHDEAATIWRIAAGEGRFSTHRHLPWTRCPPKLLKAIREEDGAVAPRAVIATTGKEGMRTFNPDVVSIKVVGLSEFDTVPLETLKELLREREVAVVRVEDVNIRRP